MSVNAVVDKGVLVLEHVGLLQDPGPVLCLGAYLAPYTLKLGLHPKAGLFLYPAGYPVSFAGQKNFTWFILSSKPRSPLNITIKFRKL